MMFRSSFSFLCLLPSSQRSKGIVPLMMGMCAVGTLPGCILVETLSNVGEPPELSQIQDPSRVKDYKPVSMPMPTSFTPPPSQINSLWQNGSRAFFKDQRASRVGDVVTVDIKFEQKAKITAKFKAARTNTQTSAIPNMLGYEKYYGKVLPKAVNPSQLGSLNSNSSIDSEGKQDLTDTLDIKIATTIIQVLPNGNMVLQGRREMRISGDVRTLELRGIIRREDITAGNRIKYSKIAEARISDVTKGEISDLNETPWGQQLLNKILPF